MLLSCKGLQKNNKYATFIVETYNNEIEAESFMIRKTEHLVSIEGKRSYKPDGESLLYKN